MPGADERIPDHGHLPRRVGERPERLDVQLVAGDPLVAAIDDAGLRTKRLRFRDRLPAARAPSGGELFVALRQIEQETNAVARPVAVVQQRRVRVPIDRRPSAGDVRVRDHHVIGAEGVRASPGRLDERVQHAGLRLAGQLRRHERTSGEEQSGRQLADAYRTDRPVLAEKERQQPRDSPPLTRDERDVPDAVVRGRKVELRRQMTVRSERMLGDECVPLRREILTVVDDLHSLSPAPAARGLRHRPRPSARRARRSVASRRPGAARASPPGA